MTTALFYSHPITSLWRSSMSDKQDWCTRKQVVAYNYLNV